jgi:hypothetical protein
MEEGRLKIEGGAFKGKKLLSMILVIWEEPMMNMKRQECFWKIGCRACRNEALQNQWFMLWSRRCTDV